ncbi:MAG: bifunctional 3-deoxy-7-phosphoheptulonate synthase/chorismate mutase type II [Muribaculaceae bacterium]|nr:bifunctional 3-deoxy-7-phosphoheptulonate synthase/chorismate mutase type II [Muribaculaceae bacterium]MDE6565377.1 bifunctional 3-deoxy-7-phosphoheptulonate synthase/chorismate mutase type II [Muribaculaceae bacterium]
MELNRLFSDDIMSRRPLVLAGPCSAESEAQILEAARALAAAGVKIFRAGVWKPRTKPGGFEGIGSPALQWLAKAKAETGMLIATEVANERHTREALDAGVDVLWIGARTSANPFAVQEIADVLAALPQERRDSLAVLVKNPVNPDLELWIGAMERINGAGIRRIGAIHRGFSAYGKHIYRNPPKWRIPIELHRRLPDLPIICDPSHIGGKRELIAPLSQQALDMNFDGLIVECHCHPDSALSDSAQQITPDVLAYILETLAIPSETSSTESLGLLRKQIDRLDDDLLELLAKRMRVARDIGRYKKEHNMPVLQPGRYNDLMQKRVDAAVQLDLNADFIKNVLASIHEESVRQQLELQ